MKKILFASCLVVFAMLVPFSGQAQENIAQPDVMTTTLEESVLQALLTNPDVKSFGRNVDLAEENIDLARSGYRPDISLSADMSHIRSDNDLVDEWSGQTGKSVSLNIRQPVFRGGQTLAEIKEQIKVKAATESRFNTLVQNTVVEVVNAYMDSFRALQATKVNEENVSLLGEQLKATQARFKAGELTKTDTSQAEARLAEAQAALEQSRAAFQVYVAQLKELTGITEIGALDYPEPDEELLPLNLDEALKLGLVNNPVIHAAEENIKAQAYNIEKQEGAFWPQVNAGASLGYERNPAFNQFESQETATVSLNASVPLYQSGVLRNRLQQSKILEYQAKDDLEAAKRAVTKAVISAWEEYSAVSSQITAREAQVSASKIAFEGVRLEEEVGARSILDVLDANQDIRDAELALIDAESNKVTAYYALLGAIGLLGESFWDNSKTRL